MRTSAKFSKSAIRKLLLVTLAAVAAILPARYVQSRPPYSDGSISKISYSVGTGPKGILTTFTGPFRFTVADMAPPAVTQREALTVATAGTNSLSRNVTVVDFLKRKKQTKLKPEEYISHPS